MEMRDALEGKNLEKEASLGKANGLSHANEYVIRIAAATAVSSRNANDF